MERQAVGRPECSREQMEEAMRRAGGELRCKSPMVLFVHQGKWLGSTPSLGGSLGEEKEGGQRAGYCESWTKRPTLGLVAAVVWETPRSFPEPAPRRKRMWMLSWEAELLSCLSQGQMGGTQKGTSGDRWKNWMISLNCLSLSVVLLWRSLHVPNEAQGKRTCCLPLLKIPLGCINTFVNLVQSGLQDKAEAEKGFKPCFFLSSA